MTQSITTGTAKGGDIMLKPTSRDPSVSSQMSVLVADCPKRGIMSTSETVVIATADDFLDVIDEIVSNATDGVVSDESVATVVSAYNGLDRANKATARKWVESRRDDSIRSSNLFAAQAYISVRDAMVTSRTNETKPTDPTESVSFRIAALIHAARLIRDGKGATVTIVDENDNEVESADVTTAYYMALDMVSSDDMPDVVRKSAEKMANATIAASGARHDIAAHITQAMSKYDIGTFVSIAQLSGTETDEFPEPDSSLSGRIQARLFPKSGKCTVDGVRPVRHEESPQYGCVRTK